MYSLASIPLAGCVAALLAGLAVLWRSPRSVAKWGLTTGLALLAVECALAFLTLRSESESLRLEIQAWKSAAMGLQMAPLLLFSLAYGRGNAREFVQKWRWGLWAILALTLLLALGLRPWLVVAVQESVLQNETMLLLGPAGLLLNVVTLLVSLLVLMNFEKTLTASVGSMRWRIKYMIFGVGIIELLRVYTSSQALLYSARRLSLAPVEGVSVIVGCLLMGMALRREAGGRVEVYPSASFLQFSFTLILAGGYLVVVGLFAEFVKRFGGVSEFPLKAFLIMVAIVGLAALLFSERLRRRVRLFISRHLKRPLYDYRKLWLAFAEDLQTSGHETAACRKVARWLSEVLQSLSVSVWLADPQGASFQLAASTDASQPDGQVKTGPAASGVAAALSSLAKPLELEKVPEEWARALCEWHSVLFSAAGGSRLCVPFWAGRQPIGFMILGDRVGGMAWTHEDMELATCATSHLAAHLRTLQLSHRLLQAKEMEAFQTMSTFFVHDLKNATSTLSMMLQNLERHAGDPAFLADALRSLSRTVAHLEDLILRLSQIRHELRIQPKDGDLNEVVRQTLSTLDPALRKRIQTTLPSLPRLALDSEQLQKVLVNLLLNARDASQADTPIQVETAPHPGGVSLSVRDQGCGMEPEFIARSLFKPFQTTKKKGLGIGMYQSRLIIEAHEGRIEVDSQPGAGTTFRVCLPA